MLMLAMMFHHWQVLILVKPGDFYPGQWIFCRFVKILFNIKVIEWAAKIAFFAGIDRPARLGCIRIGRIAANQIHAQPLTTSPEKLV